MTKYTKGIPNLYLVLLEWPLAVLPLVERRYFCCSADWLATREQIGVISIASTARCAAVGATWPKLNPAVGQTEKLLICDGPIVCRRFHQRDLIGPQVH